jgi:tetratricopeptide (TPR) repeat protein
MMGKPDVTTHASRWASALLWVGRALLLAPEATFIAALLCVYLAFGGPLFAGVCAALLVIIYMARTAALYLARAAIEDAQYPQARALIQFASALYPWSADTLALRGTLALAMGAPEEAETALRRAIALLPGQPSFHAALSSVLLELGRPGEAAAAARDALLLDKRSAPAYLYLAEAERVLGKPPEAVERRLRDGLEVARGVAATAALQCALAGHLIAEQRTAEASLVIQSAESLLPRCSISRQAELHFYFGELLTAQGQIERAREYFQGVETLDPQGRYAAAAWRASRS